MTTPILLDSLIRSLQVGSLHALMAVGLTLTFAVLRLPNFAHAELITVGAYVALVVSLFVSGNPLLVMGAAFVVAALVALLSQRIVFRPLAKLNTSIYTRILASFALAFHPLRRHSAADVALPAEGSAAGAGEYDGGARSVE